MSHSQDNNHHIERWRLILLALLLVALCASACTRKYKTSTAEVEPGLMGKPAPDFRLEAENGTRLSPRDYLGASKVVLVFYRGYW